MAEITVDSKKAVERCCTECGKKKPWTRAHFPFAKGTKNLQLCCRACRSKRATQRKLAAMEDAALKLFISKSGNGGNTIPHSAEMLESVVTLFGGANGLATAMLKQYYDAAPGGRIRSQMLEMITRLTLKNTEMGGAKKPLELYSQEELEEEMARTVRQVYVIEGEHHELPAPELANAGLLCQGQDVVPASGDTQSPDGGVAALFSDPAATRVSQGFGE